MTDFPQTKIGPENLVALDDFTGSYPLKIDLVYAQPKHPDNMFGGAIYRADAKMWCHRNFAPIILRAAEICFEKSGYIFELKDCLRTTEAQALMAQTDIVKANPQWLEEPGRLLSPPGKGGHPRGMAVDIILLRQDGSQADMGTAFDYLTTDRANNPAARNYKNFDAEILKNRQLLEDSMMQAAADLRLELYPLPQEWWDFRFPAHYANLFAPISDANMPPEYRMTAT